MVILIRFVPILIAFMSQFTFWNRKLDWNSIDDNVIAVWSQAVVDSIEDSNMAKELHLDHYFLISLALEWPNRFDFDIVAIDPMNFRRPCWSIELNDSFGRAFLNQECLVELPARPDWMKNCWKSVKRSKDNVTRMCKYLCIDVSIWSS